MSLLSRIAVEAARGFGMLARTGSPTDVPASYLVVAGGGGGGHFQGGGGGAGGYQTSTFTLSTLNTYTITIGAGGIAGINSDGGNGGNSVISGTGLTTVTSIGGGGGDGNGGSPAGSGGSGGGGGVGTSTGGSGTSGQGNNGGNSTGSGAGGGGASAAGSNSGAQSGGNGGNGSASSISGSSVTYAGGGGGGGYANSGTPPSGSGGTGGGGAGGITAVAGTANLGGGGGGGAQVSGTVYNGAAGGSGIVIISYASATPRFVGGTLTTSGGNQIHTFTSSGTLSPITPVTASYLVVAGGAGGATNIGGGGGAGGLLTSSTTLYSGATYVVTVGAGGSGGASGADNAGSNGSNSILSGTGLTTITATGGGGGGRNATPTNAGSGGSGGGAGEGGATFGTGTAGQGNNGGSSFDSSGAFGAGGGGGASAVGANGSSSSGGNGGAGSASSISGTSITYAGGGGGGGIGTVGSGGAGGGGGAGTSSGVPGTPGTANLGGGGGAGGGSNAAGGAGGSGVVIISYAGSQVFNGGLVTSSGGNTIHTFTATGALTPLTNNLTNSLRFRSSASAYLNRTPTVAGNRRTWTWSAWVKLGRPSDFYALFGSTNNCFIGYGQSTGGANLGISDGNTSTMNIQTTALFRDPSAWYHFVVALDTTQATAANRVKIYVNGNQQTAFVASTYPSQNAEFNINNTTAQNIGRTWDGFQYFDGYMDDIYFIDGQALEPYFFGNNDANGVWKPIQYRGTYGTNGFYLNFSNTTSTTTLGFDSSPNGNNWTTNNISLTAGVTYDAMTDVPTNTSATTANYAVMTPAYLPRGSYTLSEANLRCSGAFASSNYPRIMSTMGMTSGKYYWEYTGVTFPATESCSIGIKEVSSAYPSATGGLGAVSGEIGLFNTGRLDNNGSTTGSFSTTFTTGDVIGMAFDATNGTLNYYKNGSALGSQITGIAAGTYAPAFDCLSTSQTVWCVNYGQRPFAYTPPTGFVALNTFNLPTPTILQGNRFMDATLYTGTGTTQVLVNQGQFKPDLVWTKSRSNAYNNALTDSVRGVAKGLFSDLTNAEDTASPNSYVQAFNSNGFSVNSGSNSNFNGATYVGWQWQAGQGTNTTNTAGSITSTVSVNTTAGFSIVTYTGNSTSGATIGHGLGVAPKIIIVKTRNAADNWAVYHSSTGATQYLQLNTTNASASSITLWNNTSPTSTVFSVGTNNDVNDSARTYVAYCWADVSGFSKAFSYTGNGSADGPMVYLGFRPKFIMIKRTDSTSNWVIFDTSRSTYNLQQADLYANLSDAEATNAIIPDILSNGFKVRTSNATWNTNGGTWIGMAWAEHPFKNSNAR